MKKISILMLLLPFMAAAQKSYTISGNLSELKGPAKVYLAILKENAWKEGDSVITKNGKFQFTGSLSGPRQAVIRVKHLNIPETKYHPDQIDFFLENSRITVTGTDSIKNAKISGSVAERENQELEALTRPLTNTISRIMDRFRNRPRDPKKPIEEDRKKAGDSVVKLVADIKDIQWKFAESHLGSFMGMYVYNIYVLDSKFNPLKAEPLFHRFSAELQSSELGKNSMAKIEAAKRGLEGKKISDFTQNDLNGQPFKLSSLRGKYVLIDFWASWCVPCRAENPNVVKAYQELKGGNFEIVGVSLDQGQSAWAEAVKKDGLPWIHVSDLKGWKNEVAVMYGINSVPQNILINPEGIIIARNLRGEDLSGKLKALIK